MTTTATDPSSGGPRLTRRRFLVGTGAVVVAASATAAAARRWLAEAPSVFVSASDDPDGRHYVSAIDGYGAELCSIAVGVRCHGSTADPRERSRVVVFARRPGTLIHEIDLREKRLARTLATAPNRHLYGHGSFSADGSLLFTAENDMDRGVGLLVVRDGRDLSVLEEIPTGGAGPHEICLLPGSREIIVANGGLVTEPESRVNLNVPDMDPSLVRLDVESGRVLWQSRPEDHYASVRHLTVGAADVVGVALQYYGAQEAVVEMVAFHTGDGPLRNARTPRDLLVRMKQYTSSICFDRAAKVAAVSAPKGDLVLFYDVASGDLQRFHEIRDAGGIALSADGRRFLVTTGLGEVHEIDATSLEAAVAPVRVPGTRWDNHLVRAFPA